MRAGGALALLWGASLAVAAAIPGTIPIAVLHTLLERVNYTPFDTKTLFVVEGIVTTHTNLAGPSTNILFYMQDASAGIAVFWTGGATRVMLQAGDRVAVIAPLTQFHGLLELAPSVNKPATSVTWLSSGNTFPAPLLLEFNWQNDPALIEPREGAYVVASNVFLALSSQVFPASGNLPMTNAAGESFTLRVDSHTDLGGQAIPAGPLTVYGVLSQYQVGPPFTSGYELLPTRLADLISPGKPPVVRFTNLLQNLVRPGDAPTNRFSETSLRPGERLTLEVAVADPEGREVTLTAGAAGLPAGAHWDIPARTGKNLTATFVLQAREADVGGFYLITLTAANRVVTNNTLWTVYVPTAAEQQVVVTEFLANPTSSAAAPYFNPLRRAAPAPHPATEDEFIELVNLAGEGVELQDWAVHDAISSTPRLKFHEPTLLAGGAALILYGGPTEGFLPVLDVPAVVARETSAGLALNNDGDAILLRNPQGRLISRIVYSASLLSSSGSLTRYPDANGPFVPQAGVGTDAVTPGRQWDGEPFRAAPPPPIRDFALMLGGDGAPVLNWLADLGRRYTVLGAVRVTGPYLPLAAGLSSGPYADRTVGLARRRFYRLSSP